MKASDLFGVLFLSTSVVACSQATQSAPLRVTVTASDGAVGRVDTAALQRVIENEIARGGIARRQLVLSASFDSPGFVESATVPINPTRNRTVVSPQLISNLSATPWADGLIVQHGDHVDAGSRANQNWRREVVVGTYTISDASGNVLEQRPVVVGALDPEVAMMPLQLTSIRTTGHYLASRVAALSQ